MEQLEKLMNILEERIKFHEGTIEILKKYGMQFNDDIKISEGQLMEDRALIEILFNVINH